MAPYFAGLFAALTLLFTAGFTAVGVVKDDAPTTQMVEQTQKEVTLVGGNPHQVTSEGGRPLWAVAIKPDAQVGRSVRVTHPEIAPAGSTIIAVDTPWGWASAPAADELAAAAAHRNHRGFGEILWSSFGWGMFSAGAVVVGLILLLGCIMAERR